MSKPALALPMIMALTTAGCTAAMSGATVVSPPEIHPTYVMEQDGLYRVMLEESVTQHWLFGERKISREVERIKMEGEMAEDLEQSFEQSLDEFMEAARQDQLEHPVQRALHQITSPL